MAFFWHIIAVIAILAPAFVSYTFLFGRGKILFFGPTGMTLLSAYSYYLTYNAFGHQWLPAAAVLIITTIISALIFAWLALRLEPDGLGIISIAAHLAMLAVVLNWQSLTRGPLGLTGILRPPGFVDLHAFALLAIGICIMWSGLMWRIDRSRLGRRMQALGESTAYAESLGISRSRVYVVGFLLQGMAGVISTILYTQFVGILHPNDYVFSFAIFYLIVVIAGKPGSVIGAIVATILLTALKEGIRFIDLPINLVGPLRLLLFGLILLGALWVRRKTLFPVQRSI